MMTNTNPPILFNTFQSEPQSYPCMFCDVELATTQITTMSFACDACADEKIGPEQAEINREIDEILERALKEQRNAS